MAITYLPKRNGNTRVEWDRRPPFTSEKHSMEIRPMSMGTSPMGPEQLANISRGQPPLVRIRLIRLACLTCTETSGNSVLITTMVEPVQEVVADNNRLLPPLSMMVPAIGYCEAVRGTFFLVFSVSRASRKRSEYPDFLPRFPCHLAPRLNQHSVTTPADRLCHFSAHFIAP